MAESAKGWHNIQLAVMGFIGFCGILRMGDTPSGPEWLTLGSTGVSVLAFVSSLLSMWMVGGVAYPLYTSAEAHMPPNAPRRLRGGIRMTFVSIVLMALAGVTGWWPAGGEKVQVTDANGASACGSMMDSAPVGSLRLKTADGVITINLRAVASMSKVSSC
jgi:hypothetical protein